MITFENVPSTGIYREARGDVAVVIAGHRVLTLVIGIDVGLLLAFAIAALVVRIARSER